jgi:hypothetical protein
MPTALNSCHPFQVVDIDQTAFYHLGKKNLDYNLSCSVTLKTKNNTNWLSDFASRQRS